MAACKDRGEQLLDDVVLSDDHPLQLLLHQHTVLTEFLQDVAKAA